MGAPEELRAELRGQPTSRQIDYCARLRPRPTRSLEHQATVRALRATAQRIQLLQAEADQLQTELAVLVGAVAPWLLEVPGVGAQELSGWVSEQPADLNLPFAAPRRLQRDPTAGEVNDLECLSVVPEPRPHGHSGD